MGEQSFVLKAGKLIIAVLSGAAAYCLRGLGGMDILLNTLLWLMIFDYIAGVIKAIHGKRLSSAIGFIGISRKVLKLMVVGVAFRIDQLVDTFMLREIVIMFFITNEGLSILENVALMGVPLPKKLEEVLLQFGEYDKGDDNAKDK